MGHLPGSRCQYDIGSSLTEGFRAVNTNPDYRIEVFDIPFRRNVMVPVMA